MITIFEQNGIWDLSKIVRDKNAIIQECLEITRLWLTDAFWNETNGINYINYIGMNKNDITIQNLLKNDIQKHLYKVLGVEKVSNINLEFKEKKIAIKFDIETSNNIITTLETII